MANLSDGSLRPRNRPLHPEPAVNGISHQEVHSNYEVRDPSDEEKQQSSWLYHGYPALSKWMASSNEFFLLRRFSATTARCLLYLQNEIAKREKELAELDAISKKAPPGQSGCDSFDDDPFPKRNELIVELTDLLQQYYGLINSYTPIKSVPTARPHHIRNLHNWSKTYPEAIRDGEQHMFTEENEGDLFPIIGKAQSPLRLFLEHWRWLRFRFALGRRADRVDSATTTYTSDTGFDIFVSILIVTAGLGLLFGPMWWLDYVSTSSYRLAIITGFVTTFTVLLWLAAGQRPFEILAATAAYAAVLMVFLQRNGIERGP